MIDTDEIYDVRLEELRKQYEKSKKKALVGGVIFSITGTISLIIMLILKLEGIIYVGPLLQYISAFMFFCNSLRRN